MNVNKNVFTFRLYVKRKKQDCSTDNITYWTEFAIEVSVNVLQGIVARRFVFLLSLFSFPSMLLPCCHQPSPHPCVTHPRHHSKPKSVVTKFFQCCLGLPRHYTTSAPWENYYVVVSHG